VANSRKVTIIDPASGWKYGFPKILPCWVDSYNMNEWLIKEGYPKDEINLAQYSRFWQKDVDENELPLDYYERK
jgi:hypothetical protein